MRLNLALQLGRKKSTLAEHTIERCHTRIMKFLRIKHDNHTPIFPEVKCHHSAERRVSGSIVRHREYPPTIVWVTLADLPCTRYVLGSLGHREPPVFGQGGPAGCPELDGADLFSRTA